MMISLLSIFDPSSSIFPTNYSALLFISLIPLYSMWKSPSVYSVLFTLSMKTSMKMFSMNPKEYLPMFTLILFMIVINYLGLIPLTYSYSSHPSFNFSMSFIMCVSSTIWSFFHKPNLSLAHFTPSGCPPHLIPFMIAVEMISFFIRPLTLALRLTANMLAGHLILSLMGILLLISPLPGFVTLIIFYFFEMFVSFIQGYVFTALTVMYWMEHNNH